MNRYRTILILFAAAVCWAASGATLTSPDGNLRVEADVVGKSVKLALSRGGTALMQVNTLQFDFERAGVINGDYEVVQTDVSSHNSQWQTVYGEQDVVTDCYNALVLGVQAKGNAKRIELEVRR